MKNNYDLIKREDEAKNILQCWIDSLNNKGWNENNNGLDKNEIDALLDILESMLLIYNIFAEIQLELVRDESTYTYSLEAV